MTLSKIHLVFLVLTLACTGPVVSGSAPLSWHVQQMSGTEYTWTRFAAEAQSLGGRLPTTQEIVDYVNTNGNFLSFVSPYSGEIYAFTTNENSAMNSMDAVQVGQNTQYFLGTYAGDWPGLLASLDNGDYNGLDYFSYLIYVTEPAETSTAPAPVYSLPPTTKLDYPSDNYANLLSTPIQIQAEATGGFAVLGKFFWVSSVIPPWNNLFQMRDWDLDAGSTNIQIHMYSGSAANKYRLQLYVSGISCYKEFDKPAADNAWYSVELQYTTADTFTLKLNGVLVTQATCNSGFLENFTLNRVIVANANWAGLRLYDSLLTDAEVATELDKICVPADTCADVLTAGCDSAPACPLTCSDNTYESSAENFWGYDACEAATPSGYTFGGAKTGWAMSGCYCVPSVSHSSTYANLDYGKCMYGNDWDGNTPQPASDETGGTAAYFSPRKSDGTHYTEAECSGSVALPSGYTFSSAGNWGSWIQGCYCYSKNWLSSATYAQYAGNCYYNRNGGNYPPPDPLQAGGNIYEAIFRPISDTKCTPCPTDGTVVAGCSCPENTYESSALPENANVIFEPENNQQYFDGTRYEHLSDSTFNVATNGGFTVILKAKATQTASTALRILDFGETSGTYRSVIIARNPSNSFLVTYYDSANGHCGWYSDTDLPLTVDKEHTIVFRLDTSNQIVDVKIDDSLHKTMACSKGWDTVSKTVIGANRNSLSNKWLGDIYYVYVYDRYMDDSAVTSIVAIAENGSGCVPCPTDGTVVAGCSGAACQDIPPTSKFSFEEGLVDETSTAVIQKIAGTGSTFVSDATHGQVLNVHHNLYRIDSATLGAMLDANAFTVSFWIRLKEFGSDVMNANLLLSRYDWNVGDNRGGFILWINAKKIALKQYYGPNTTPHEVESTQELSILDNWYHIMLVKVSSTESKIFIDGTLDNSFTFSPAAKSMHNPMDVIGLGAYCYGNTGNADGYSCAVGSSYDDNSKYYMNDLRFYDFAASDTQVAAIANGGDISTCSETTDVPCCSRTWPD